MTTTTTPQTFLVYTAKVCPYAQRALLALDEAGVPYQPYEIDLLNKPEWYESKVNAASKVPVLVLDPGSDKQVNLPESLVIAEYVAEQYEEKMGEQALLPKDALDRARVRYTIERFSQLVTPHWGSALRQRSVSSLSSLLSALLSFQSLLPPSTTSSGTGGGPYFFGSRYSLVEVCVAPFLGRIITLSNAGLLPGGEEGRAVAKTLLEDPKYERLAAYWNAISNRPSWKNTFDEGAIVSQFGQRVKGWEEAAAETKPKQ